MALENSSYSLKCFVFFLNKHFLNPIIRTTSGWLLFKKKLIFMLTVLVKYYPKSMDLDSSVNYKYLVKSENVAFFEWHIDTIKF